MQPIISLHVQVVFRNDIRSSRRLFHMSTFLIHH